MSEPIAKSEWMPTMSGSMSGYKPQWKHRGEWGRIANKKLFKGDGGDEWTDIEFTIIRGGAAITLNDGTVVPLGVPFPRSQPGVLETIFMLGHEQCLAIAWSFAAHIASIGGEVEVRAESHEVVYDIKARLRQEKK